MKDGVYSALKLSATQIADDAVADRFDPMALEELLTRTEQIAGSADPLFHALSSFSSACDMVNLGQGELSAAGAALLAAVDAARAPEGNNFGSVRLNFADTVMVNLAAYLTCVRLIDGEVSQDMRRALDDLREVMPHTQLDHPVINQLAEVVRRFVHEAAKGWAGADRAFAQMALDEALAKFFHWRGTEAKKAFRAAKQPVR